MRQTDRSRTHISRVYLRQKYPQQQPGHDLIVVREPEEDCVRAPSNVDFINQVQTLLGTTFCLSIFVTSTTDLSSQRRLFDSFTDLHPPMDADIARKAIKGVIISEHDYAIP